MLLGAQTENRVVLVAIHPDGSKSLIIDPNHRVKVVFTGGDCKVDKRSVVLAVQKVRKRKVAKRLIVSWEMVGEVWKKQRENQFDFIGTERRKSKMRCKSNVFRENFRI